MSALHFSSYSSRFLAEQESEEIDGTRTALRGRDAGEARQLVCGGTEDAAKAVGGESSRRRESRGATPGTATMNGGAHRGGAAREYDAGIGDLQGTTVWVGSTVEESSGQRIGDGRWQKQKSGGDYA